MYDLDFTGDLSHYQRQLDAAGGLSIKTVTGMEFDVSGPVKYNPESEIYYCAGQSWPKEIVVGVVESAAV